MKKIGRIERLIWVLALGIFGFICREAFACSMINCFDWDLPDGISLEAVPANAKLGVRGFGEGSYRFELYNDQGEAVKISLISDRNTGLRLALDQGWEEGKRYTLKTIGSEHHTCGSGEVSITATAAYAPSKPVESLDLELQVQKWEASNDDCILRAGSDAYIMVIKNPDPKLTYVAFEQTKHGDKITESSHAVGKSVKWRNTSEGLTETAIIANFPQETLFAPRCFKVHAVLPDATLSTDYRYACFNSEAPDTNVATDQLPADYGCQTNKGFSLGITILLLSFFLAGSRWPSLKI